MVALQQQNHQINFNGLDGFVAPEQPHGRLKLKFLQEVCMAIYELPAKFSASNGRVVALEQQNHQGH